MKNPFLSLLCYICITLITSCDYATKNSSIFIDIDNAQSPDVEIVETVKLETNEDAFVGKFAIYKENSSYIVVADMKKIAIFTKDGKLYRVFSPIGKSKTEVMSLMLNSVTEEFIEVYDGYKNRAVRYDFDGKYIESLSLPVNACEYIRYGDYIMADMHCKGGDKRLAILDNELREVVSDIDSKGKGISYGANKFCIDNGSLYYLPPFYNSLFEIRGDNSIKESYTFDFGRYWASDAEFENNATHSKVIALWEYLKENNKVGFLSAIKSGDYILLRFELVDKKYSCLIDLDTNEQYITNENINLFNNVISIKDGILTTQIDAYNYKELYPNDKSVSQNDNPVIIRFKVK